MLRKLIKKQVSKLGFVPTDSLVNRLEWELINNPTSSSVLANISSDAFMRGMLISLQEDNG